MTARIPRQQRGHQPVCFARTARRRILPGLSHDEWVPIMKLRDVVEGRLAGILRMP